MTSKRYFSIPMVAGALGVGGAAMVARAAEPTTAELQAQIQALQTKVQQLETQSPQQQQQTATVNSVLSDANKRSQLMEVEGFTAGHTGGDDGHFVIQSGDGNFRMVPWLQIQFRNVLNYTQNGQSNGKDTFEDGFEINRAKIGFMGNVFSPDITYNINWASGENNGGAGKRLHAVPLPAERRLVAPRRTVERRCLPRRERQLQAAAGGRPLAGQ